MYRYGFWNFVLDFVLCVATGGLWILWILWRQARQTNRRF